MEKYIQNLVDHEIGTYLRQYCEDPRQAIILLGGVALNFIGDFLGSPDAKFEYKSVKLIDITLTGTSPEINKILLEECETETNKLQLLIQNNKNVKKKLEKWASFGDEPILLLETGNGKFKSFDGMHRIVGHVLAGKKTINAYILKNHGDFLPNIEAHVVYDIIKAYKRSEMNDQDKSDLQGALRLMARNTGNIKTVLQNRFNKDYLNDDNIQSIIKAALN